MVIEKTSNGKDIKLKALAVGQSAVVRAVGGSGGLRQHFLDMGLVPGTEVTLVKYAPMGDPMELRLHGYELTLRLADAAKITVSEPYAKEKEELPIREVKESEHPGYGEGGRYHVRTGEDPVPENEILTFALAGNQNCGKTTLFNQLTGSNQHVGNFPGVTVDRKSGKIRNHPETEVTDLPGIYSLSPYSEEEIVSRSFILNDKPCGIINILDATNIERNLYLTMQMMELDVPMVLALNMMDEVKGNGGSIDVNSMEALLGVPVVPISAAKNEGVDELVEHAVHVAHYRERPGRIDFCAEDSPVHRALHGIMHLIEDHALSAGIPARFAAGKLIEGDRFVAKQLSLSANEKEMIEHIILQMETESGLDRAAAMADMRFTFIRKLCDACVTKPRESKEHARSRRIDKILTGKYTAIPSFIAIMGLVFFLTFNVIGRFFQWLLEMGISALKGVVASAFDALEVNKVVRGLVLDGIFDGVGSILSFVPVILVLFLFLSLLEDSGYMARVAFVMDKLLRKIGLSGKSVVPMLIGFGCTVPAVMATRTLSSARDRKMTVLLTPFMSCSAKLPIYVFFAGVFFPQCAWLVMICLYFLGIVLGILAALIAKRTSFKGEAVPFVMELPNYRLPGLKNVSQLLWEKAKDFIKRAFTVILLATAIIWFLQNFDFSVSMVENTADGMLAKIAGFIAPIFKPLGFGDYRFVTALFTGFLAKETVVSTAKVLFAGSALSTVISPAAALSFLVFSLLYTPCVASIAAIRRELGRRWAICTVIGQCLIAWAAAGGVALVARVFGFM